jgi:hypothetical protein
MNQYVNSFINNSPTIRENAGADIVNAAHKAVAYDANGNVILATSGYIAIGLVLGDATAIDTGTQLTTKTGFPLDILIKEIGLLEAGGDIAKGDLVTINAEGQGVKAGAGDFIFGLAFTAAAEGEAAQVQITRSGYNSGGGGTTYIESIVQGSGITVDASDPVHPVVSVTA